jgi:hypothetical protein
MQIYYFTRTGRSRQIAEALAQKQGATALPISDGKSWSGAWGYWKAGLAAMRGKKLPIVYAAPTQGNPVAVVFPVWAGKLPPAVKTFAQEVGRQRITAIPTSLGSALTDREGFAKVMDLIGKEIAPPELP